MNNSKHKYIGILFFFTVVVVISYTLVSSLTMKTDPSSNIVSEKNKVYQERGIIDDIDQNETYFIIKFPTRYTEGDLSYKKIYITNETKVEEGSVLEENGVIYYENIPLPSTFSKIKIGDKIIVNFLIDRGRFNAVYIRHGEPLPGI